MAKHSFRGPALVRAFLVALLSLTLALGQAGGAFANAEAADIVTLPADLTAVGDEAFNGDVRIKTVEVPEGCLSIGSRAFAGCSRLDSIYLPRSAASIAEDAFSGCEDMTIWCYADTYAYRYAIAHGIPFRLREPVTSYKIAILTGSTAQGAEEYEAAAALASAYGGKVLHDTYPDDFVADQDKTIAKLLAFAADPEVKAIVAVQAVAGTAEAFRQIRAKRVDIVLIAGVPAEELADIASAADIVLGIDENTAGGQVAGLAAQWDCDVLVHYSFPRHLDYAQIAEKHDRMKSKAEAAGVMFVDRVCMDPLEGSEEAHKFISEDLPKVMAEYAGKKVCFYCTNCGLQPTLQSAVLGEGNAYYALPCCPSPFHGFQQAFGLSGSYGDIPGAMRILANFLKSKDALGRFSTWPAPANMAMIRGAFAYGKAWAEGSLGVKVKTSTLRACIAEAVGSGASISQHKSYTNYLLLALEPVDFADYL